MTGLKNCATILENDGGVEIRSKAKHDAWQKALSCQLIEVDGSNALDDNFAIVKKYL